MDNGHLQIGIKKISPGAHWMGITGIACRQKNVSFDSVILIHTIIATGMMDVFISCWNKKYATNRVRPETSIRELIDPDWQPLLQTPPFPEYPSGHSVISAYCSEILTHFFGEPFFYTDDVEKHYGIQPRKFSSFGQASAEAAISRFYGGIHFMDAIENGKKTGTVNAIFVLNKIQRSVNPKSDQ